MALRPVTLGMINCLEQPACLPACLPLELFPPVTSLYFLPVLALLFNQPNIWLIVRVNAPNDGELIEDQTFIKVPLWIFPDVLIKGASLRNTFILAADSEISWIAASASDPYVCVG